MAPPPTNPSAARKVPTLSCINNTTSLDDLARSLPNMEPHFVSVLTPRSTELGNVSLSTVLISCAISAKAPKSRIFLKTCPWGQQKLCPPY